MDIFVSSTSRDLEAVEQLVRTVFQDEDRADLSDYVGGYCCHRYSFKASQPNVLESTKLILAEAFATSFVRDISDFREFVTRVNSWNSHFEFSQFPSGIYSNIIIQPAAYVTGDTGLARELAQLAFVDLKSLRIAWTEVKDELSAHWSDINSIFALKQFILLAIKDKIQRIIVRNRCKSRTCSSVPTTRDRVYDHQIWTGSPPPAAIAQVSIGETVPFGNCLDEESFNDLLWEFSGGSRSEGASSEKSSSADRAEGRSPTQDPRCSYQSAGNTLRRQRTNWDMPLIPAGEATF